MNLQATSKPEPVIHIKDLKKSFGDNYVLRDFNIDLQEGENVVVLGKSGSGKSVLIKCIIGLMLPDAGNIQVFGEEVPELSHDDLDIMRVKVGFLFQSNALYDSMTVRENLEFPLRRHWIKTTKESVNDLVMEALTNVGLAETIEMMPAELSGGMRKRIALARTLILKPKVILYDEPTTGLDPITGKEISHLMLDIQNKYNTSSIIISHDMNCAKITANRIVMLIDGVCYATGTYAELSKSNDKRIKQFFD
ncbi:MAG TPA: ATP-binding cassette domain-containing protein [Bacteroidia bacterium]|jgi:phospholipid/cholesterol/gamma-HCH transport system ATP-binding protein|nr:ATP-binding cassette domain-containing protein [Bacteroidia bacterium]